MAVAVVEFHVHLGAGAEVAGQSGAEPHDHLIGRRDPLPRALARTNFQTTVVRSQSVAAELSAHRFSRTEGCGERGAARGREGRNGLDLGADREATP